MEQNPSDPSSFCMTSGGGRPERRPPQVSILTPSSSHILLSNPPNLPTYSPFNPMKECAECFYEAQFTCPALVELVEDLRYW